MRCTKNAQIYLTSHTHQLYVLKQIIENTMSIKTIRLDNWTKTGKLFYTFTN